jgi:hypothetical protein
MLLHEEVINELSQGINLPIYIYIMTCVPIARQQLGKHIPAQTNMSHNKTYIAKQRINKHASLKKKSVCSA